MAKSLDNVLDQLPAKRRSGIQNRAAELATLKDLRQAMYRTQKDLAAALNIGQDSVSRLEKRSDMLLSTLREYIEAMGGELEIVARFPDRPPVHIEHITETANPSSSKGKTGARKRSG